MSTTQPPTVETPNPRKVARVMYALRIAPTGLALMKECAAEQGVDPSEFARQAIADACAKHVASRRR